MTNMFRTKYGKFILLLLLFLSIRLVFLLTFGSNVPIARDYENRYRMLALSIINGEEYGTGSDLEYPPLYPILLAFNYELFGEQITSIQIFQILFDLSTCLLIFFIASRLINKKIGYIAMLFWGLYPMAIWQVSILGTEHLFTAFVMLFMLLLILSYDKRSLKYAVFAGVVLGAAMLTRPIMTYFPIFVLIIYWVNLQEKSRVLRLFIAFLIGFFITLSPWIIRNYQKHNDLEIGTKHPDGQGSARLFFEGSDEDYVFSQGEIRYQLSDIKRDSLFSGHLKLGVSKNEILFNAAAENITSQPLLYLKLVIYKIWKLFTFTTTGTYDIYIKIINVPIMILSIFGLFSIRRKWKEFLAIILVVIYVIGIHSLLIAMLRYLMPVFPFVILFAAIGVDSLYMIINQRNIRSSVC